MSVIGIGIEGRIGVGEASGQSVVGWAMTETDSIGTGLARGSSTTLSYPLYLGTVGICHVVRDMRSRTYRVQRELSSCTCP